MNQKYYTWWESQGDGRTAMQSVYKQVREAMRRVGWAGHRALLRDGQPSGLLQQLSAGRL
jgi:hypothetical protein